MVEGPKVLLKCERLKRKILNKTIVKIKCFNAHMAYEGQKVSRVISVGKELFIVMENECVLRLHFGMNGSEIICQSDSPPQLPPSSRKQVSSTIFFDDFVIFLYDTTVSPISMNSVRSIEERSNRDICCGLFFDTATVLKILSADQRPVHETIMDQFIMPGVGNIIKCEGLFLSHIHPDAITAELSIPRLDSLVNKLRSFAAHWLLCCRKNKTIVKAVYGLKNCSSCGAQIKLVRSGVAQRITFYCPLCQTIEKSNHSLQGTVVDDHSDNASSNFKSDVIIDLTGDDETPSSSSSSSKAISEYMTSTTIPPGDSAVRIENSSSNDKSNGCSTDGTNSIDGTTGTRLPLFNRVICKCRNPTTLQRVRKEVDNTL